MFSELYFRLSLQFFIPVFFIHMVRDVDAQFEPVGTEK